MKRILSVIIIVSMVFLFIPSQAEATESIKVGEYVQLGSYNGDPILWKVINIDNNGPLLLSDKILCMKAFDSVGGNNYWEDSDIRQWLNSMEKGFLAEGNFTLDERKAIKVVNRQVLLSESDKDKAEGGSEKYLYPDGAGYIQDAVQNYDKAYYHTVTDSVFFLNIKELKQYFYDREWEHRACPTEKAVENSSYKDWSLSSLQFWGYWLDTPSTNDVRFVTSLGYVLNASPTSTLGGVRPALYLDLKAESFKSGSGSERDPYVVKRGEGTLQQKPDLGNNSDSIKIVINGKLLSTDGEPYAVNGRVLVPFRAIFEALGATVYWDKENLMATGGKGLNYVTLSPDNPSAVLMKIKPEFQGLVNIQEGATFESFGRYCEESSEFITLSVPPTIKNGRIMVPVRFIAESLGSTVKWDGNANMVIIQTIEKD